MHIMTSKHSDFKKTRNPRIYERIINGEDCIKDITSTWELNLNLIENYINANWNELVKRNNSNYNIKDNTYEVLVKNSINKNNNVITDFSKYKYISKTNNSNNNNLMIFNTRENDDKLSQLLNKIKRIKYLHSDKIRKLKQCSDNRTKILILKQIELEVLSKNQEHCNCYNTESIELQSSIEKKDGFIKQGEKRFLEVEEYINIRCESTNDEGFKKYSNFNIREFIHKNTDMLYDINSCKQYIENKYSLINELKIQNNYTSMSILNKMLHESTLVTNVNIKDEIISSNSNNNNNKIKSEGFLGIFNRKNNKSSNKVDSCCNKNFINREINLNKGIINNNNNNLKCNNGINKSSGLFFSIANKFNFNKANYASKNKNNSISNVNKILNNTSSNSIDKNDLKVSLVIKFTTLYLNYLQSIIEEKKCQINILKSLSTTIDERNNYLTDILNRDAMNSNRSNPRIQDNKNLLKNKFHTIGIISEKKENTLFGYNKEEINEIEDEDINNSDAFQYTYYNNDEENNNMNANLNSICSQQRKKNKEIENNLTDINNISTIHYQK